MTHSQSEIAKQLLSQAGYKKEGAMWVHHSIKSAIMHNDLFKESESTSPEPLREALEKMCFRSQELFTEKKNNPKNKKGELQAAWNNLANTLYEANKLLNGKPVASSSVSGEDEEALWDELFDNIIWDERESNYDVTQIMKSIQRKYQITKK